MGAACVTSVGSANHTTWVRRCSSANPGNVFAIRFGRAESMPLFGRVRMPSHHTEETGLVSRSLLDLDAPNLQLVNASLSTDGKGVILHLREVEGGHAIFDTHRVLEQSGALSATEVNVLEEELAVLTAPLLIEHYETRFIKLNFDP